MNDDARAEEQQRLEERVGHQVEQRCAHARGAQRHEHQPELRDGGVRQHLLDVVLYGGQQASENRRDGPDDQRRLQDAGGCLEYRQHARNQVDAGGDHRRGVNQRRCRRGASHRIRQPHMQRHLGGLAHGGDQESDRGGDGHTGAPGWNRRQDVGELPRADRLVDDHEGEEEAQVSDAGGQKRLLRGPSRRLELVPEADQEVRAQPHELPADEEQQEVVGKHEGEHGSGEQRQDRVVPALTLVAVHIADRVDLHAARHERDGHEQDGRDRVELHAELEGPASDDSQRPRVVPLDRRELGAAGPRIDERCERQDGRSQNRTDGQPQRLVARAARKRDQTDKRDGRESWYEEQPVHPLALQLIEIGHFAGLGAPEDGQHERKAESDLSRRIDHREDREEQPVHRLGGLEPRECNEVDVDGDRHELKGHQYLDGPLLGQRAVHAHREQHRGQHQERLDSDLHHSSPSLVHQTAPTSAAVSNSEAISNGRAQPRIENICRPIAAMSWPVVAAADADCPASGKLASMKSIMPANRTQTSAARGEKSLGLIASSSLRSVIMMVKSMRTATATEYTRSCTKAT